MWDIYGHITCENYWVLGERSALLNSDLPLGWMRTMPQVAQSLRDPMAQCHSISECQTQSYCPDCVSRSISLAGKADAYRSIILVKEMKEISIDRLFVFTLNSYKTKSNLEIRIERQAYGISTEAGRTVLIFPQAGGLAREVSEVSNWFQDVPSFMFFMFTVNICLEIRKYGNIIGRHASFRKSTEVLPTTKFSTHLDPMSYSRSKKLNKRGINKTCI